MSVPISQFTAPLQPLSFPLGAHLFVGEVFKTQIVGLHP